MSRRNADSGKFSCRGTLLAVCLVLLHGYGADAAPPERIWIDTDVACDGGQRKDPDDCLALYALAVSGKVEIAGISTVFGNTTEPDSQRILTHLSRLLTDAGYSLPVPRSGADRPLRKRRNSPASEVTAGLCAALADTPVTILALGPLTNVAEALASCPARISQVRRIVFVGGRHAGHVFHPAEDAMPRARFFHGPVFRDLNVSLDPDAVDAILAHDVPIQLAPYALSRQVEITEADLTTFAQRDRAAAHIVEMSQPWLAYGKSDMGREGFYPFDLMAAAALLTPDAISCSNRRVALLRDQKISPVFAPRALLLNPPASKRTDRTVSVCTRLAPGGREAIRHLLAAPEGDDEHA